MIIFCIIKYDNEWILWVNALEAENVGNIVLWSACWIFILTKPNIILYIILVQ